MTFADKIGNNVGRIVAYLLLMLMITLDYYAFYSMFLMGDEPFLFTVLVAAFLGGTLNIAPYFIIVVSMTNRGFLKIEFTDDEKQKKINRMRSISNLIMTLAVLLCLFLLTWVTGLRANIIGGIRDGSFFTNFFSEEYFVDRVLLISPIATTIASMLLAAISYKGSFWYEKLLHMTDVKNISDLSSDDVLGKEHVAKIKEVQRDIETTRMGYQKLNAKRRAAKKHRKKMQRAMWFDEATTRWRIRIINIYSKLQSLFLNRGITKTEKLMHQKQKTRDQLNSNYQEIVGHKNRLVSELWTELGGATSELPDISDYTMFAEACYREIGNSTKKVIDNNYRALLINLYMGVETRLRGYKTELLTGLRFADDVKKDQVRGINTDKLIKDYNNASEQKLTQWNTDDSISEWQKVFEGDIGIVS